MMYRPEVSPWRKLIGITLLSALFVLPAPVLAQDDEDDVDENTEEVVVAGSRIDRDTFSSVAPLRVIGTDVSRNLATIDASDILQDSTASGGRQLDITFQGFVLDNGPGASSIDLRGLGAQRTLVPFNGRRISPERVARILLFAGHATTVLAEDSMSTAHPVSRTW